ASHVRGKHILVGSADDLTGQVAACEPVRCGGDVTDVCDEIAEGISQAADLIGGYVVDLLLDVALRDTCGGIGNRTDDAFDRTGDQIGQEHESEQHDDQHGERGVEA